MQYALKKQKLYKVVIFYPHSYFFIILFLTPFINRTYSICTTRGAFSFTKLLCHGLTFSGSLRTFDIITYPGYPVRKIGDLAEGVWNEIVLRSARNVLGINAIW